MRASVVAEGRLNGSVPAARGDGFETVVRIATQYCYAAAAVFLTPVLWVFIYNSGLGYDALEFLVISRSMVEGVPFYTYAPSKSFGFYYLIAGYLMLPGAATHAGITCLVTTLLVLTCAAAAFVMRPVVGTRSAWASVVLIAAAGIFMELNYLLPEGLIVVCGLGAVAMVGSSPRRRNNVRWVLAGLALGAAIGLKLVATLYVAAFAVWIPIAARMDGESVGPSTIRRLALLGLGIAAALAVPAGYFWWTSRLDAHLEWTYQFPLISYPSRTDWLSKLYTKLLWVWLLVGAAVVLSLRSRVRPVVFREARVPLLLLMGTVSLLPLIKSQASHFAFPGAAFLLLYSVVAFDVLAKSSAVARRRLNPGLAGGAVLALVLSGLIYQPETVRRLTGMRSYADEVQLGATVAALVPPGRHAIFFGDGLTFYWLSGRYPNWPILHTDVQATYLMSKKPESLLSALEDPNLALVEFDPCQREFGDGRFFAAPAGQSFLEALHARLRAGFQRDDDTLQPRVLWTRAALTLQTTEKR